ncbi:MAG: DUF1926 domain-containing protein [Candidatus Omnitrophica bacterium]|nr:DUF1926 domain-containing protein [Candidatus Omnitrophota bacterium]
MRTENEATESHAKFAMAFHCYQPVDNFGWEYSKACKKAYLPFLRVLEKHPSVKATLHYSGNLLLWMEKESPEFLDVLKLLLERGQVELMGGGCYEPILAVLPEEERVRQVRANEEVVRALFGVSPAGVWLAEKVWESSLADTLSSLGVRFTILDDHQFSLSGLDGARLYRPCYTGPRGREVAVLPSITRLRYSMPFMPPERTLQYMADIVRERGRDVCFCFADDGEKFGAWPYTYRWVYGKKWLERFFTLLEENSGWLRSVTCSEAVSAAIKDAPVALKDSSYAEMMRWSGGSFRNFFQKYTESGRLFSRMLSAAGEYGRRVSSGEGRPDASLAKAGEEILKAQANCPYWHGTFGGIYLPHLREGAYRHLINAQRLMARELPCPGARTGAELPVFYPRTEKTVSNGETVVCVSPEQGGSVTEIDHIPSGKNLTDVMTRRREAYHDKLERRSFFRARRARKEMLEGSLPDVHGLLGVRERGLRKKLFYDERPRASFVTRVFPKKRVALRDVIRGFSCCRECMSGKYSILPGEGENGRRVVMSKRTRSVPGTELEVLKSVEVKDDGKIEFESRVLCCSGNDIPFTSMTEFNFMITDRLFEKKPRKIKVRRLYLKDRHSSITIIINLNCDRNIYTYPIHTVNETEQGLVKTYQGLSLLVEDNGPDKAGGVRGLNVSMEIGG